MDIIKWIRAHDLYNETQPERNFSYISNYPKNYRIDRLRDNCMYIVFPEEFKEESIIETVNDIFNNFFSKRSYTYTWRFIHNIINTSIESPIDESETFDKDSIALEIEGMPKIDVLRIAEVIATYPDVTWNSVMIIDPKDPGYWIGDFYKDEFTAKDEDDMYESLNESSINRIFDWINKYDIACISASRKYYRNATGRTLDDRPREYKYSDMLYKYSNKENRNRNNHLKAVLLKMGYGVTSILGSYIETNTEKGNFEKNEQSFLVVNINNDSDFFMNIFQLAEFYNQDSFLYKKADSDDAFLIGTNEGDFPGYMEKVYTGKLHSNIDTEFFSRLGNRSFAFVKDSDTKHGNLDNFESKKRARIERQLVDTLDTYDNQSINAKNVITNWNKEVKDVMESFK